VGSKIFSLNGREKARPGRQGRTFETEGIQCVLSISGEGGGGGSLVNCGTYEKKTES